MLSENKHKWEKTEMTKGLVGDFIERHVCVQCNCERLKSVYKGKSYFIYERGRQIYSYRPDCFGPIPINEQTIDR